MGPGGRRLLTAVLLLAAWATAALTTPAVASPTRCLMGAYLVSVSQVDTAAGTFRADFWMWSVCPTADVEPLKTVEFVNGVDVEGSLESNLQRGRFWWATRKFSGVFRQDFLLKNYPFDEQPLTIDIEEGVLDTRDLVYAADTHNSGMDPAVKLPGWRLESFQVLGAVKTHPTTYGDPSLSEGSSTYAALQLRLGVERAHMANFVKSTFSLHIAALLALVSLLIVDGRMSLLGATTFAVVLSFVSVERIVGPHDGIYLLDQLHLAAMALIMGATAWGVISMRALAHGADRHAQHRRDVWVAVGLGVAYALAHIILVSLAVLSS